MMDSEQQAYTVREFCRVYAISRKTLYDLWKAGQGPVSYKIGRSRRVSRRAAEVWQQELEVAVVASPK
jgi:predicted DNA-binding transcriptional regulator AlpA